MFLPNFMRKKNKKSLYRWGDVSRKAWVHRNEPALKLIVHAYMTGIYESLKSSEAI